MAKFEGEATPKSLTGRREDTGFSSLQTPFPPYDAAGREPQFQSAPMTYQPGPSSSGLEGRPGASRMEPASMTIPPSGVLATGPPTFPSQGYSPSFSIQQGREVGGPSLYAPQLSVPAQDTIEAINTHETNTTLDNFPAGSMGLQPVPYNADPPTPPQALSQLDLNATVWNPGSTVPQSSFEAPYQPPGTITTVVPGSMAGGSPMVSFSGNFPAGSQTLPPGSVPNYPPFAPQSSSLPPPGTFAPQSSSLPRPGTRSEVLRTSGGLQDMQGPSTMKSMPPSIDTVPDDRFRNPSSRGGARPFEPMQPVPTTSGTWQPEVKSSGAKKTSFAPQSSGSARVFEPPESTSRPYTGKVLRADGSITEHKGDMSPRVSKSFTPSSITGIGASKSPRSPRVISERDIGTSKFDKVKFDDDESEKENLISDIRERDATIARLLRDVREKRAIRMSAVEELSDRMDHLEARLLSQHLDLMK